MIHAKISSNHDNMCKNDMTYALKSKKNNELMRKMHVIRLDHQIFSLIRSMVMIEHNEVN